MQKSVILCTCSIVRNFLKTTEINPVDYQIPGQVNISQLKLRSEKFDDDDDDNNNNDDDDDDDDNNNNNW